MMANNIDVWFSVKYAFQHIDTLMGCRLRQADSLLRTVVSRQNT